MAVRIFAIALGIFVVAGSAGAQSQSVHPPALVSGDPNGAAQSQPNAEQLPISERITQLELQVQSDPENAEARTTLVMLYRQTQQIDKAMEQLLWIVGHHPEWNAASMTRTVKAEGGNGFTKADYQQLKAVWEGALLDHPNDPEVLYHGGMFLQRSEGERALQWFRQARQLQPSNPTYLQAEASLYEAAVFKGTQRIAPVPLSTELAARLSAELPTLTDPALLTQVGGYLARMGLPDGSNRQLGLRLLERAANLEPDNPQWAAALAAAIAPALPQSDAPPGTVRIGGAVVEANLIRKVEPVYPALAKSARISGSVEFTVTIGTEGRIQNLQLMRGHPLLVQAAKEAVLEYMYRPTLLNGNPVPVMTSVVVNFELPPQ